jgi:hypothetical protein
MAEATPIRAIYDANGEAVALAEYQTGDVITTPDGGIKFPDGSIQITAGGGGSGDFKVVDGIPYFYIKAEDRWMQLAAWMSSTTTPPPQTGPYPVPLPQPVWPGDGSESLDNGWLLYSTFPHESYPIKTPADFPLGVKYFGISYFHYDAYENGLDDTSPTPPPNKPPYQNPTCFADWTGGDEGPGTTTDYIQAIFLYRTDGSFVERRRDSSWRFVADGSSDGVGLELPSSVFPADFWSWQPSPQTEGETYEWAANTAAGWTNRIAVSMSKTPGLIA